MRHAGDFFIGCNHAGKGDARRPRIKEVDEKLFRNREEVEDTRICFVCGKRWHRYSSMYDKTGKKILVFCDRCKNKIYK